MIRLVVKEPDRASYERLLALHQRTADHLAEKILLAKAATSTRRVGIYRRQLKPTLRAIELIKADLETMKA